MQELSGQLAFEEAARVRDKLTALEDYRNTQKVVLNDFADRDLIAIAREENEACAVLFRIREGKIIGRMHYYLKKTDWQPNSDIIETFINRFYTNTQDLPKEIFLQEQVENCSVIEQWLSDRAGGKVVLVVPKIG